MNTDSLIRLCNDNKRLMYTNKSSASLYDNTDYFFNPDFYDKYFLTGPDAEKLSIESIDRLLGNKKIKNESNEHPL